MILRHINATLLTHGARGEVVVVGGGGGINLLLHFAFAEISQQRVEQAAWNFADVRINPKATVSKFRRR